MNALKFGMLLVIAILAAIFIGTFLYGMKADFAGLIMIGPVPIIIGTSSEITVAAMIIGLLLMVTFLIIGRKHAPQKEYMAWEEEISMPCPGGETKDSIRGGGAIVMIGPIPVVFGYDKKSAIILMILAICLMLLAIVLAYGNLQWVENN